MTASRSLPVLVVDDESMIRAVVRATLEQVGLTDVHEAADGAAALAMLNQHRYGLVISDWNMLPMTGYGLLRHVRRDRTFARRPSS